MTETHKSVVTSPQAQFLIWNYKERMSSSDAVLPNSTESVLALTSSIISINTYKNKGDPSGRFEVILAPTHNWISRLTVGSWCVINMTKDLEISDPKIFGFADEESLKWFGRIEDIRLSVDVDQETGARKTTFSVTGSDWSSVFKSILYVDPVFRNSILPGNIGNAAEIVYDKMIKGFNEGKGLPSSTENVKAIIRLWGAPLETLTDGLPNDKAGVSKLTSGGSYTIPTDVNLYIKNTALSGKLADSIEVVSGKLTGPDSYSDVPESVGFIPPNSIFGTQTVWSIMLNNCNDVLNELFTDIRFENGIPKLAVYKRIRPFIHNKTALLSNPDLLLVQDIASSFLDVKEHEILIEDVINADAGVNWNDMINFIEVRIDPAILGKEFKGTDALFKADQQELNKKSYERNGFRPKIVSTTYFPTLLTKDLDITGITKWKALLREWYFNQHNQLNGSITITGQNCYIGVGDNISVDSQVLTKSKNFNIKEFGLGKTTRLPGQVTSPITSTKLVAHVQSVRHSFGVDPTTGAKSFTTTIDFVRGIIVDRLGLSLSGIVLDDSATTLSDEDVKSGDVRGPDEDGVLKGFL